MVSTDQFLVHCKDRITLQRSFSNYPSTQGKDRPLDSTVVTMGSLGARTQRAGPPPKHLRLIYEVLHLIHVLLQFIDRFTQCFRRMLHKLTRSSPPNSRRKPQENRLRHVAISGYFAISDIENVARVISMASQKGVKWVTVHDRSGDMSGETKLLMKILDDVDAVRKYRLQESGMKRHENYEHENDKDCCCNIRICGKDESKNVLVEYARVLAGCKDERNGVDVGNAQEVMDWIDADCRGLLLGCEPDVVIVFSRNDGDEGRRLRSLGGFGVWQLRLTQIYFWDWRIDQFGREDFEEIYRTGLRAPKRFGK